VNHIVAIPARLYGFERCFQGYSKTRQCSPASIKPKSGATVVGLIFKLNSIQELDAIRKSEGFQIERNTRTNVYEEVVWTQKDVGSTLKVRGTTRAFDVSFLENIYPYIRVYVYNERHRDVAFNDTNKPKFKEYIAEIGKMMKESNATTVNGEIGIPVYDVKFTLQYKTFVDKNLRVRVQ
jgi:hypothetical protein